MVRATSEGLGRPGADAQTATVQSPTVATNITAAPSNEARTGIRSGRTLKLSRPHHSRPAAANASTASPTSGPFRMLNAPSTNNSPKASFQTRERRRHR